MAHVCAYIRQSDEEGHKKELSCPTQEQRFLDDVARRREHGDELTYEMAPWDEGKSGGEMDRPGLQWLLANLDRFDEVWVYDHDRLVRHDFYAPLIMRELRSRGVRLWCACGGADEETPMGRFMTDLRFRFGAYYREEIAERAKQTRDFRLKQGLWSGHAPTGYKFIWEKGEGSRRILVPDPETAPKVKAIFRMLAEGQSQRRACRLLGITQTTVIWQRGNPLYIGLVYKHREKVEALESRTHAALWALANDDDIDWLYPGRHEPLIDAETWDAVELRRRAGPRNKVSRVYGLSGRIRCEECGGVLRVSRKPARPSDSLRCERCRWERSYRYAETTVITALAVLTESPEFEKEVELELRKAEEPEDQSRLSALSEERARVVKKLDRALDRLLDTDEVTEEMKQRAVGLKRQREALDREIAEVKAEMAARPSAVRAWRETQTVLCRLPVETLWREASPGEQRELVQAVFQSVTATPARLTFRVRGLDIAFQLPWLTGDVYHREVAGPGIEPGTP